MTTPPNPCEGKELCGAPHPTEDLVCIRPPGTNAYNDETCTNVHVHYAVRDTPDGPAPYRWEDA